MSWFEGIFVNILISLKCQIFTDSINPSCARDVTLNNKGKCDVQQNITKHSQARTSWRLNSPALDCLFKSLPRLTTKKTWKHRITGLFVRWIHRSPVDSPYNGPVMRKTLPCNDVIMAISELLPCKHFQVISHSRCTLWCTCCQLHVYPSLLWRGN